MRTVRCGAARGLAAVALTLALVSGGIASGAPAFITAAAAASRTYRVKTGDTLTSISAQFGVTTGAIVSVNDIVDPNDIIIGTRLVIPSAGSAAGRGSGSAGSGSAGAGSAGAGSAGGDGDSASSSSTAGGTYVVGVGDTLSSIASHFGITVASLEAVNDLTNPDVIVSGTRLVIPGRRTMGVTGGTAGGSGGSSGAGGSSPSAPLAPVYAPSSGVPHFPAGLLAHSSRLALRPVFQHWARYYGVAPGLLEALAWMESGWQSSVVSSTGAVGIGQLEPSTVRFVSSGLMGLSRPLDPRVPAANIEMSAAYLAWMIRAAHGSVANALGGYYQGLGSLYASGPFPSTRQYVLVIGGLWHEFRSG